MKKITVIAAALLLAGCQSTPLKVNSDVDTNKSSQLESVNRDALYESANIELPSNYDVNAFSKMRIAAYIDRIKFEDGARKTKIDNTVIAKLLENELARTKRYEVLTRNCDACDYEVAFQAENTRAEGAIQTGQQLNPDYVFESTIDLDTSIKKMSDHTQVIFSSLVTTKLVNPSTGEIVHSFAPIRHHSEPKTFFEVGGKRIGGFNLDSHNELQNEYARAAQKAIQILVNRSMSYFPVGGRMTNYLNGRFGIDAGVNQGFAIKQPVVLFYSDSGLDIPIASADVTPKANGGSGIVMTWKDDPDAQTIRKKLEAGGKDYLQYNKIYAVSVGAPEDWEN